MPTISASQSFCGFVREHLALIESEQARGLPLAAILASFNLPGKSACTFRNALYRARKRRATKPSQFQEGVQRSAVGQPTLMPASAPSPLTLRERMQLRGLLPAAPATGAATRDPRDLARPAVVDLRELVRTTPDSEIF